MAGIEGQVERWFKVADVVRQHDISERSIRAAIASGDLHVVRLARLRRGRFPCIRIPASSLTAWLNSARATGGHE
jgi:hypothetical protein